MKNDSLIKRFSFKSLSNFSRALLSIVNIIIVPKVLGPSDFGQYNFLRSSLISIIGFLDFGSSQAFFVFNSKNKENFLVLVLYGLYSVAILFTVLSLGSLSVVFTLNEYIWPQCEPKYIVIASILAFSFWFFNIVTGYADSKGETVRIELYKTIVNASGIAVIMVLVAVDVLNITTYYIYQISLFVCVIIISILYFKYNSIYGEKRRYDKNSIKDVWKYFYSFCSPLVVYSLFSVAYDFFDRWFLQKIAGSVEQGYYSLGFSLATICLLIVSSLTPIFMREVSHLQKENNIKKIQYLYYKYFRIFFFIIASISIFIAFHSSEILTILYGDTYQDAVIPIFIMALYPINAVLGQLSSSIYLSSERTSAYKNISIFNMLVGVIMCYFLVAPSLFVIPGLELGAIGLALKKFATQIFSVNVLAYFNCKFLNMKYRGFIKYQVSVVFSIFLIMWIIKTGVVFDNNITLLSGILRIIIDGIAFMSVIIAATLYMPQFFGLDKKDLNKFKEMISAKIRR